MKTNQNLIRKMGEFDVIQRTSDGMFDANALLGQWNKANGKKKTTDEFLQLGTTKSFINVLIVKESHAENSRNGDFQVITKIKGRNTKNGKTKDQVWMHPFLFIDFAMWINPEFKYEVIKFVYDQLIQYRNDAGDSYKEMASAICKIVPKGEQAKAIKEISMANNHIIYGTHEKDIRNKQAEESKVKQLDELQTDITKLINDGFISSYNFLMDYLRRKYKQKYIPAIFSA